jgi:hypothetical protein
MHGPTHLAQRSVGEWALRSSRRYGSPFVDVLVEGVFTAPSGEVSVAAGFYDGDGTWRIRFNPGEAGEWSVVTRSRPHNPDFESSGSFTVTPCATRGFLRATPGDAWGFRFENGEPAFILGDTTYDLFAMEICGGDVAGFMERRQRQGFNLLRTRLTPSRFHLPEGNFEWQDREVWPWGGSRSMPRFDLFNLEFFRSVDVTVRRAEALGLGLELIMEGWGNEFPFNSRQWFTPEWEEHWLRYLIARYDAYNAVWFWTPLNEYEYYPNGDWHWTPNADRWAMRIARRIREMAPHGHIMSIHNGPTLPPFAKRFAADPEAVDAVMFQAWGTIDRDEGWLARGIEDTIAAAFAGWTRSAVFAEWGYERNPVFQLKLPMHEFCDRNHTRRSAWRGVMMGLGIVTGQENSWGPWMELAEDTPGVSDLIVLRRLMTEDVPFHRMRPAPELIGGDYPPGHRPLALLRDDDRLSLIYLPAGGRVTTDMTGSARWFDPRLGTYEAATAGEGGYFCPPGLDEGGHPHDYLLLIEAE